MKLKKTDFIINQRKQRYDAKLSSLWENYSLLKKWFESSNLKELQEKDNIERIYAIYHSAQLTIETMIDISAMLVKDLGFNAKDNYSNYKLLKREGIISPEVFEALVNLNGLRNRLVHDYNKVVDEIAWRSIDENLEFIEEFEKAVKSWLKGK
ncbi:MAG: type VII toxin-antitoxin system HepT family RNase toxin [Promethearchaeota archaeon]